MALVPYTITAIERDVADTETTGKQVVVGAICSMYTLLNDTVVILYDDSAGNGGSTSKTTGVNGQVTVYVNPGEYRVSVNNQNSFILLGSNASASIINQTETQTLAALQTTVTLANLTTEGTAFYVAGLRLTLGFGYSITSSTQIELSEDYPDGTLITAVQNDLTGPGKVRDLTSEVTTDTLIITDSQLDNKLVIIQSIEPVTIQLQPDSINSLVFFMQDTIENVAFEAGAGVTIKTPLGLTPYTQNSICFAYSIDNSTWVLGGDLG